MPKKRILVVDDSRTATMMASMILGKGAYEILTAVDGEEGVRKAHDEKPDLIMLDVMMPKMDGYEACRRLRGEPETQAIPIIMMTTRGESEFMERGYASGCTDYVTKPINSVELLAKVKNCIGD
ncbi:MAG: response regulator [Vicinamibacteria bacterium]|nr:response regulator [Vicinamibacteria bacterium]